MSASLKLPYLSKTDHAERRERCRSDDMTKMTHRGQSMPDTTTVEESLMEKGMPYSQAHAVPSRMEFRCRHHPDELHDALAAEGWA
jgi:hypothetical protein